MREIAAAISGIVGVVLLALLAAAAASAAETGTVEGKALCKLDGTSSGCCIGKLEKGIAKVKGVKDVRIDAKKGTATILCEKGAKVSMEEIKKAVEKADQAHDHGFKVIEIKRVE